MDAYCRRRTEWASRQEIGIVNACGHDVGAVVVVRLPIDIFLVPPGQPEITIIEPGWDFNDADGVSDGQQ